MHAHTRFKGYAGPIQAWRQHATRYKQACARPPWVIMGPFFRILLTPGRFNTISRRRRSEPQSGGLSLIMFPGSFLAKPNLWGMHYLFVLYGGWSIYFEVEVGACAPPSINHLMYLALCSGSIGTPRPPSFTWGGGFHPPHTPINFKSTYCLDRLAHWEA